MEILPICLNYIVSREINVCIRWRIFLGSIFGVWMFPILTEGSEGQTYGHKRWHDGQFWHHNGQCPPPKGSQARPRSSRASGGEDTYVSKPSDTSEHLDTSEHSDMRKGHKREKRGESIELLAKFLEALSSCFFLRGMTGEECRSLSAPPRVR